MKCAFTTTNEHLKQNYGSHPGTVLEAIPAPEGTAEVGALLRSPHTRATQ